MKKPFHSTSTLRLVVSLGLMLCTLLQQPLWAQDFTAPIREEGRLCGFFPCPQPEAQIEPNAGKWKPWILEDVRQVRPSGPPSNSISAQEIGVLKQLSFQRDAAAMDLIKYWDAGSPSYPWNEFAGDQLIKSNLAACGDLRRNGHGLGFEISSSSPAAKRIQPVADYGNSDSEQSFVSFRTRCGGGSGFCCARSLLSAASGVLQCQG